MVVIAVVRSTMGIIVGRWCCTTVVVAVAMVVVVVVVVLRKERGCNGGRFGWLSLLFVGR